MELEEINCVISKVQKKYAEVRQLLDERDKSIENEPYKLKYAAMARLEEMKSDLNYIFNSFTQRKGNEDTMLAIVHLDLGLLHSETEELKAGEEQFMKCIDCLTDKGTSPATILPMLSALNQLGIIWSQWSQPEKAKVFLDQAESIYKEYKNSKTGEPINMADHFGVTDDKDALSSIAVFEKIHTLTLYYAAQVYGSLKDHQKSAIYCHRLLRQQLIHADIMPDLDYIDWALNAATLSQCFMENNGFSQARNHLAAASFMLQKYESLLQNDNGAEENETYFGKQETFRHRSADVARCWAKYGILLLSLSKQRLLDKAEKDDPANCTTTLKSCTKINEDAEKFGEDLTFDIIQTDIEPFLNDITDKYLLDFNDARAVFLNVQKWLETAKVYYSLEDHASDYVQIIQDISQAYKYLSFFEENEDRRAKMHKRRVDALESVITELHPQYYKDVCRQIWVELGETYSDILDIKLDQVQAIDERPTPHMLKKINQLAKSAINSYQSFLSSLEVDLNNSPPKKLSEDIMQPTLIAYFQIGRLYLKIISSDKALQLENTNNSMNAYRFIINYCENDPKATEIMKVELGLCQDLVNLLPLKIQNLQKELMD